MPLGFRREALGSPALCKICRGIIPKGTPAIPLDTWISNHSGRLFFHLECFPEKGAIR
jgi:hypothetical protein